MRAGTVTAQELSFEWTASASDATDHSPAANLAIFEQLMDGRDTASIYHRMVCLNAGAGFVVAGLADTLEDGTLLAADLLAGGKVRETVDACRRCYEQIAR